VRGGKEGLRHGLTSVRNEGVVYRREREERRRAGKTAARNSQYQKERGGENYHQRSLSTKSVREQIAGSTEGSELMVGIFGIKGQTWSGGGGGRALPHWE